MNLELIGALNELERERGISREIILDAIQAAIISAYKRSDDAAQNVRVEVSEKSGQIRVFAQKEVVEEVLDPANEISLDDAREINPNYAVGDIVEVEVTPRDFGRIAAQTAKQVVIQRIREAERTLVYEEFANREGDVVTGIIQRTDHRNVFVDLGKVEAILPPSEQMPRESYVPGNRIKAYVSEVRQTTKGPQVILSRTHPGLLKRLFELEVPEIHDGVVEIRAVAREAGNRSKIAVSSRDPNVDPVGACVGPRGMRVQAIVQELKGEKIDIVEFSINPERFVANALSPARVMRVIVNEAEKTARAIVPDHQLSLAIGREGQNARLAARLTGWKIDIKSESQMAELALLARRAEEAQAQRAEEVETAEVARAAAQAEPAVADTAAAEAVELQEPQVLEPGLAPEPVELAEAAPPAQEPQEGEFTFEIPPDVFEELEEEGRGKVEPPPVKAKKSRAAKKAELKDIIEEDVFDEEEPLPTLFDADEEDEEAEPAVFVVGSDPAEEKKEEKPKKAGAKEDSKSKGGSKMVLKDLAELKRLLEGMNSEEE